MNEEQKTQFFNQSGYDPIDQIAKMYQDASDNHVKVVRNAMIKTNSNEL